MRCRCQRGMLPLAAVMLAAVVGVANGQEGAAAPGGSPEELSRFADGLFRRELFDMAATEYQRLVQEHPDFERAPAAYFYWAECHRLQGRNERARAVFETLRRTHPTHPLAHRAAVHLATLALNGGDADGALALLGAADMAEQPEPIREAAIYYTGLAHNQKGVSDEAVKAFLQLAARPISAERPLRMHARLSLAYLRRDAGMTDDALRIATELTRADAVSSAVRQEALFLLGDLHFTRKAYREAVTAYRQLLVGYPEGRHIPRTRLNCGWCLLELGQYTDVAALFRDAGDEATSAEALYLQGAALKRLKRFATARKMFDRILAMDEGPFTLSSRFELLECAHELGEYAACVEAARDFVEKNPRHDRAADAFYFLGQSLVKLNRLDAAAEAYEKALKTYWGSWSYRDSALGQLADIYEKMGESKKAAATHRRLLEVGDADAKVAALMAAGEAEMQAKDLTAAFRDFRAATKVPGDHPEAAQAWLRMAEITSKQKSYEEAVAILSAFLERYPGHPLRGQALYLRGTTAFRLAQADRAIADLRASLQAGDFPDREFARLFLGYALWESDQTDEALVVFAEVLEDGAVTDEFAPELLEAIAARYLANNNLETAEACYKLVAAHKDPERALKGYLGLGRLALKRNDLTAARTTFLQLKQKAGRDSSLRGDAVAYLGETLRRLDQDEEALVAFSEAVDLGASDIGTLAMSRLGMALIYGKLAAREKDRAKAKQKQELSLRYAVSVFVLYDHPVYSADAMLQTLRVLVDLERVDEAKRTYAELRARYPLRLAEFRNRPENRKLFMGL